MRTSPKLRAIMLDWAGTTVDHGSVAPVFAMQTLFSKHGIHLSAEQIRRDMGLLKRDHIRAILGLDELKTQWREQKGHEPTEADVESLFLEFGPLQMNCIAEHSQLIEGVAETIQQWQQSGLRIGTTTGYTRAMLDPVMKQAAVDGYHPDATVCPDEVSGGRPAPWMLMRNAQLLDVYPPSACVKIGDTISDIEEGLNAGMWTIGLTRSGNMVGLTAKEWSALPNEDKRERVALAEKILLAAGAHYIAEDLTRCNELFERIEQRLV